ncbi:MAG: alpha/beta hydrolase [Nitrospinae bacterium]|nr:alpha/beta hydrolase [Nitrospinota bacterium]
MSRRIVIIHGWSDNSESFKPLAKKLKATLNRPVEIINLADYESMDDEVTFDDLVAAMTKEWERVELSKRPRSVDVVLHSTGGLIVRAWLQKNFKKDTAPIRNLVMLAPANFGSPLGHKGTSFVGRVIKGWGLKRGKKMFQVGEKLLKGLELASPFSWDLAMQDRFGRNNFFGEQKILCTVLIGNSGYSGIAAAANESGSDGTVRLSTANLNCAHLTADFSINPKEPTIKMKQSSGKIAFGVIDGENHGSIVEGNDETFERIVGGLRVTDANFKGWCKQLEDETSSIMVAREEKRDSYYNGFQNTFFLVRDQFGMHVDDYFLEFYENRSSWFEEFFHEKVIHSVHAHSDDSAYRSMLTDCTKLRHGIEGRKQFKEMRISLIARPEFEENGNVGYKTLDDRDIGSVVIPVEAIPNYFQRNRTLFVEITLKREQASGIFKIKKGS